MCNLIRKWKTTRKTVKNEISRLDANIQKARSCGANKVLIGIDDPIIREAIEKYTYSRPYFYLILSETSFDALCIGWED